MQPQFSPHKTPLKNNFSSYLSHLKIEMQFFFKYFFFKFFKNILLLNQLTNFRVSYHFGNLIMSAFYQEGWGGADRGLVFLSKATFSCCSSIGK